jgi:hypothetical protein
LDAFAGDLLHLALMPVAGVDEHDGGIAEPERGEFALRGADHRFEVTTRILDRRGVRTLLDIIASSSEFRREMHNALAAYDTGLSHRSRVAGSALRQRPP